MSFLRSKFLLSTHAFLQWFPVMTGDAAVVGEALIYVMLCCSALQFLTGLLEPVVSCAGSHRTRWAVAFVSLVAITANHFIWAMLEGLSYPGNVIIIVFLLIIVIVLGVFDMSVFVLLFLGEDKEVYGSGDPLNPFQCYP
ncbi:hypothetical protein EJB05_41166 [Eragrostis curvula]|uniref:Uncharacterized protein n=1 Tax=Eragrostis curvula TaxID=38414 RepID=A0A5J9T969_9POAL|nr:hypothetical protein EJB05_41166 [Eragrostis curvula]